MKFIIILECVSFLIYSRLVINKETCLPYAETTRPKETKADGGRSDNNPCNNTNFVVRWNTVFEQVGMPRI